jgi:predicted metal-binding membrane protein
MQHRLVAVRASDRPGAWLAVPVGWTLVLGAGAVGLAPWLGHAHLIDAGVPFPLAVGAFLAGWAVMLCAMMLPTLPNSALASPRFVIGYLATWSAFGIAALTMDAGIHFAVDRSVWLGDHTWLIEAGTLGLAGLYQFTPTKVTFLRRCCLPPPPELDLREGCSVGADSVGSCWALMLTGFSAGISGPAQMVGITAAMLAERDRQGRGPARTWIGAGLLIAAVALIGQGLAGTGT